MTGAQESKTAVRPGAPPEQSGAGHLFLQRKCACGGSGAALGECEGCRKKRLKQAPLFAQAKLAISQPGDAFEHEADHVADQVMRMALPARNQSGAFPSISRIHPPQQKYEDHDDFLQQKESRSAATSYSTPVPGAPSIVQNVLSSPGEPLDRETRAFMEPRFGHDFSRVRVHTDEPAANSAQTVNALAYTVGRDIVFGRQQYAPHTPGGNKLLAHELVHVVQRNAHQGITTAEPILQRQSKRGRCTSVFLKLPNSIVFDGDRGAVEASVKTNITAGDYTISYDTSSDQFVISPWPTKDVILDVSLTAAAREKLDTYAAYRDSLAGGGAPLHVTESAAQPGTPAGGEADEVKFNVRQLTPSEFRSLTGVSSDLLPEGKLTSGADLPAPQIKPATSVSGRSVPEMTSWPRVVGMPAALARLPSYPIPPNATGILWTQMGAGHLSVLSNVGGEMTARGFRFDMWRNLFPERLSTGVPGTFQNDLLFTLLPNQTIVYRTSQPDAAAAFADRLLGTKYEQTYRFPPRAGTDVAVCGSNCITVPRAEVVDALGVAPEILTPEGPVDITLAGRPQPGAPFEPSQAGRGATVREYLGQDPSVFAERGLTKLPVPTMTIAARGAVGFLKVGGVIFMIYGAYKTGKRLHEAYGTPEFAPVVGEETGSWTGGILGTAIGGALGGAVFCSPGGPVDLVCVAGGFVGGLIVGGIGAIGGGALGRSVTPIVEKSMETLGKTYIENAEMCAKLPWYARGFCAYGSNPPSF